MNWLYFVGCCVVYLGVVLPVFNLGLFSIWEWLHEI